MKFTHLHCHSHYSLLDGLPKIHEIVNTVKAYNMDAIAITDHGVMYGVVEFYQKCLDANIKPIIGLETYIAPYGLKKKRPKIDDANYHLTLLAKNNEGYRHLMELTSIAHLEGFYYRPRIDKEVLAQKSRGLICLSGCLGGELCQMLLSNGDTNKAKELIHQYIKIFGEENFFLELQDHSEMKEQVYVNNALVQLGREVGVPVVLTKDCHYINPSDAEAEDVLTCIYTGKRLDDKDRLRMTDMDLHLSSSQEIADRWSSIPEALENTQRIADECNVEIELGKWNFPPIDIPDGKTAQQELKEKTYQGAKKIYGDLNSKVKDRIEYELDIITKKGYAPYFLAVADYVRYAKEKKIVTTTRGSAAGSLVSYCLGITNIDPLLYKIPFERFLNPYRPSPPDIDTDFADDRRDEVIDYIVNKYGKDRVAQITTFGTMLARGSVRDVGRVLGYKYSFCDKIAKLIPFGSQGFPMTIERAIEINPELRELYNNDSKVKRLLDLAKKIEGCARHPSVHAAGVVIAPTKLTDFVPVQKEAGGERIVTQYEMNSVEAVGLLKFDFLGIRNLSILGHVVKLVEKIKGISIDLDNIPLDDKKTFELLSKGNTTGLFQLGSSGMTRYLKELQPTTIHDIMAMVALYRPGPMESIPEYIRRKHDPSKIKYLDERLKDILDKSYGIITYQDDVLLIAIKLAGYSWEEADKFRKAIGKKIPEEMKKQKDRFFKGCRKNGMSDAKIQKLWKYIEPFAAYGFNKAHAASYGLVAYQTAYMKANFPTEYMTSVLTAESGDVEKVAEIVKECENMGIDVLPPSVNESFENFTYINENSIRFGLLAIKNIGANIVHKIIKERKKNGIYKSIEDFLSRVNSKDLNKKTLESLIKCGAMDMFGERNQLLYNLELLLEFARSLKRQEETKQSSLFGNLDDPSVHQRLRLKSVSVASKEQKLSWEKELLGLYVSEHPLQEFAKVLYKHVSPLNRIELLPTSSEVLVAGVITSVKQIITRTNEVMCFVMLEDTFGSLELLVFPSVLSENREIWQVDRIVVCNGRISDKDGEKKIIVNRAELLTRDAIKADNGERFFSSFNSNGFRNGFKTISSTSSKSANLGNKIVWINIGDNLDNSVAERLRSTFSKYPGKYLVYIVVNNNGIKKKVRTHYRIDYNNEIQLHLKEIVGEENVVVQ